MQNELTEFTDSKANVNHMADSTNTASLPTDASSSFPDVAAEDVATPPATPRLWFVNVFFWCEGGHAHCRICGRSFDKPTPHLCHEGDQV